MNNASNIKIRWDLEENKIFLQTHQDDKLKLTVESWDFFNNDLNLLYSVDLDCKANLEYWVAPSKLLNDFRGFKVTVEKNGAILKEQFVKVNSFLYGKIKKQVIAIKLTRGMGDILTSTAAIKKFSEAFNQKIILITTIPDVFINNPYIEKIVKTTEENLEQTIEEFRSGNNANLYEVNEVFVLKGKLNFSLLDLKQFCAFDLGFSLKHHESDMFFYPDPYEKIENLPENFICINPSLTSLYRSWGQENWQKFINLIQNHIPVVAIGKGVNYDPDTYKNFYNIEIKNGLNLIDHPCQNTLSQAYHIISKSKTFVTMNNGLYCLALSTYNHITELATPVESYYLRVRKGIPNYNLNYLHGSCDEFCNGNLKYSTSFTGRNEVLKAGHCFRGVSLEGKNGLRDYACYPNVEKVYDSVLTHLKTNKYIV